jgi:hypothetical protein
MFIIILFACQQMKEPGSPLEQVSVDISQQNENVEEVKVINPEFQDPQQEIIVMGSADESKEVESTDEINKEPVNGNEKSNEVISKTIVQENVSNSELQLPKSVVPRPNSITRKPARVKDGWMPILVTTLTTSPIPRAVLAMPSGEEIVVRAGDLLSEEGVIVMAIGEKSVDLATISAEGGQAKVENITLASHYPE